MYLSGIQYIQHPLFSLQVSTLLLCAGITSDNNALFVERATKLDVELQHEVRQMLEAILGDDLTSPRLTDKVHTVLQQPLGKCVILDPWVIFQQKQNLNLLIKCKDFGDEESKSMGSCAVTVSLCIRLNFVHT